VNPDPYLAQNFTSPRQHPSFEGALTPVERYGDTIVAKRSYNPIAISMMAWDWLELAIA